MFIPVPDRLLDLKSELSDQDLEVISNSLIEACKDLSASAGSQDSIEYYNNYADKCVAKLTHVHKNLGSAK